MNAPDARVRVLAVDDQREVLTAMRRLLGTRGFDVQPFTDPLEALEALQADPAAFDVAILDVAMPEMNGIELLSRARQVVPELPVVMLTADDSARTAVAALQAGAFNYLTKPLDDPDKIALALSRAASHARLHRRAAELEARLARAEGFETLVGTSVPMRELFSAVDRIADAEVSVLVRGESGTGKELVARAIHARSRRRGRPFVALNCAAIPESLVDSELFGHERGAFTGAVEAHAGAFEQANGGILFLDEIGDVPPAVQLRLLRVLQEHEVRRLGAEANRPVDVRVITATLVDLEAAVQQGNFRQDLYYRLNVVSIELPPLRERGDDVTLLAAHFLKKHAERLGRDQVPRFTPSAIEALLSHAWPGNVRELENAVQRALALTPDDTIDADALPATLRGATAAPSTAGHAASTASPDEAIAWADELSFTDARKRAQEEFERSYLTRLLRRTQGNVSEAARQAGLDRSNFRRILTRCEIDPESFRDDGD